MKKKINTFQMFGDSKISWEKFIFVFSEDALNWSKDRFMMLQEFYFK